MALRGKTNTEHIKGEPARMNQETDNPYITLEQIKHALLGNLFGVVKLLQRLLDLVVGDFALALLLVVEVQTSALELL